MLHFGGKANSAFFPFGVSTRKLLIKELAIQTGKIKHANNLEITYFDQYREALNSNDTIKQTICENGGDMVYLQNKTMQKPQ